MGFSIYGSWRGPKGALEILFRKRLASHPDLFAELLATVVRARRYESYWHRDEKGEWAQHAGLPRRPENWQTLDAWVVRKVYLPSARGVGTPGFARQIERIFTELYPLYVFTSVTEPKWENQLTQALRRARH